MRFGNVFGLGLVLSGMFTLVCGCGTSATWHGESFNSADGAVENLVTALRADDTGRLQQILGPSGDDILSSGDPVSDRADAQRFLTLYDEEHWIRPEVGDVSTLLVGRDGWPFPVPIVRVNGDYVFDSETGREEVLNRRVGRNELASAQVCLAIVDAQREYVERRPMGGDLPEYAQKIVSDAGKRNGLYWPTEESERPSPLGSLAAAATAEGYGATTKPAAPANEASGPRPYHGYRYRLITAQSANASGGAMSYLVDGKLIGGFAVVAYPAEYGNSGIMTFITNHDGVVYQRDLGPQTEATAKAMTEFDPDPQWTRMTDESQPAYAN